ncbi:hypothetical protein [Nonomuraea sp. MG754425]|uniref:hypothetical protein n=1 Tax=Nonomuraea sp. MG754425 TaxID=2570319 RepID=UPI001F20E3D8|nr:hypothetical protein [Nonomuraea sp. MG754425]
MPDTPRRPRIQWQDESEYLKNRKSRIVSEAPRPSEPDLSQRGGGRDADEGPNRA